MRTLQEFMKNVEAQAKVVGGDLSRAGAAAAKALGIDMSKASIVHEVSEVAAVASAVVKVAAPLVENLVPSVAPAVVSLATGVQTAASMAAALDVQAAQAAPKSTAPVDIALGDIGQVLGVSDPGKLVTLGEAILRFVGHGFVAANKQS